MLNNDAPRNVPCRSMMIHVGCSVSFIQIFKLVRSVVVPTPGVRPEECSDCACKLIMQVGWIAGHLTCEREVLARLRPLKSWAQRI